MAIAKHLSRFHPKHYPTRLFKELAIITPMVLLIILTLNLSAGKNNFEVSKDALQQNSEDSLATLNLANQLLLNNQLQAAEEIINQRLERNSGREELLFAKL